MAVAVGILGGLGTFTVGYGNGLSYLTNDPTACANCHLPHNFVGKWLTKADNGFFHALAFTTGDFHEPIQIKARNRRVTQGACLHCHSELANALLPAEHGGDMQLCVHCHSDVGHAGRR